MVFIKSYLFLALTLSSYTFSLTLPSVVNPGSITSTLQNTTAIVPATVAGASQTTGNVPNILPQAAASVPGANDILGNATEGTTGNILPAVMGVIPTGILPTTNPSQILGGATQEIGSTLPTASLPSANLPTNPNEVLGDATQEITSLQPSNLPGLSTGSIPTSIIPTGLPGVGNLIPGELIPSSPGLNTGPQLLQFPTINCGSNVISTDSCNITCSLNPSCQSLGFNITTLPCTCPAIVCTDGQIYGAPGYLIDGPLNSTQIEQQPHVVAPCYDCVPAQIAPEGVQIGSCQDYTNEAPSPPTASDNSTSSGTDGS